MMKAVVLLSGGIDSATTLYHAKKRGFKIFCLTFNYGQRHKKEISYAKRLAKLSGSEWNLVRVSLPWGGSSLLDKDISLPQGRTKRSVIPRTYVPARNIIFLSYATSYAETIGAKRIFIGVNQVDYSGYPDCRSSFLRAFTTVIDKGTKQGIRGARVKIEAPLINKSKQGIILSAIRHKVPLEYTWSCYKGDEKPCGRCDSCLIRKEGFRMAKVKDPA